jgi:hypothetical protein
MKYPLAPKKLVEAVMLVIYLEGARSDLDRDTSYSKINGDYPDNSLGLPQIFQANAKESTLNQAMAVSLDILFHSLLTVIRPYSLNY